MTQKELTEKTIAAAKAQYGHIIDQYAIFNQSREGDIIEASYEYKGQYYTVEIPIE